MRGWFGHKIKNSPQNTYNVYRKYVHCMCIPYRKYLHYIHIDKIYPKHVCRVYVESIYKISTKYTRMSINVKCNIDIDMEKVYSYIIKLKTKTQIRRKEK